MKHRETHPNLDVDGCFGCRVAHVRMGPNTTTTSGKRAEEINTIEKRWHRDMPAYKRLRQNGLQPERIDGCADIEQRANNKLEVEAPKVAAGLKQNA